MNRTNASTSPLPAHQHKQLLDLLTQMDAAQLGWVSGYASGLLAGAEGAAPVDDTGAVTLIVATQTGNGRHAAELVVRRLIDAGISVETQETHRFRRGDWPKLRHVLLIISTHGEGEPPDTAREFCRFLHSKRAPQLENVEYGVLALGDSSYEHFCRAGRDLDARLEQLGGNRLGPRVDCDLEYADAAIAWADALVECLGKRQPEKIQAGPIPSAPTHTDESIRYGREHPFTAEVLDNVRLSGCRSNKQVHHLELSIDGSGWSYQPGDIAYVAPENSAAAVEDLLRSMRQNGNKEVCPKSGPTTLAKALAQEFEITRVSTAFLKRYAALTDASKLRALFQKDASKTLQGYLRGRHVADVVREFPPHGIALDQLLGTFRPLVSRAYSISSSELATPNEIHLTVAVERYTASSGLCNGVASGWLAERRADEHHIPIYIEPNVAFRLPEDGDTAIVMIGPGTGVAPFRGFMAHRRELGAIGKHWLFFGDQHLRDDFLYQNEWLDLHRDGYLTHLDVAWSRDAREKMYVQHRIRERGKALYAWLEGGAHVYVCGDAKFMAPDVHKALLDIVQMHAGKSRAAAERYLEGLSASNRYQRDIY